MHFHTLLFASSYGPDFVETTRVQIDRLLSGSVDLATARVELKRSLGVLGRPTDDDDFLNESGDARLNAILTLNTFFAQSFRQWNQDQDECLLDQWPARELVCVGEESDTRAIKRRWREATGQSRVSRMIALTNNDVWSKVSLLGTPYGPFDLEGLVNLEAVDRDEAESLKLIRGAEFVKPQPRVWEDDLALATRAADSLLAEMNQGAAVRAS